MSISTASHPASIATPSDDLAHLSNDELAAAVATLAAHIHAATYRLLTLIAELDRRGVWAEQGALTCAHWLGWACGIDTHTAREKVRVARALEELPLLSAAAARGELGYSKLRALTRIASAENEPDLVEIGRYGTAQHVEKFVRSYRRAERAEETAQANTQHRERSLTYWYDDDGTLVLSGRFPPETGARILSALDAAMEAHAAEQPASQMVRRGRASGRPTWDVAVGSDGERRDSASPRRKSAIRVRRGNLPGRPRWDVSVPAPAHRAQSRCPGVDGRAALRGRGGSGAQPSPPRGGRARGFQCARPGRGGPMRDGAPRRSGGGDGPAPVLRRRPRRHRRRPEGRAAQRWPAHPQHLPGASPRAHEPRPRLPLSRMRGHSPPARTPCAPLGGGRRDRARQPRAAVPGASPTRPRRRLRCSPSRRRRAALHRSEGEQPCERLHRSKSLRPPPSWPGTTPAGWRSTGRLRWRGGTGSPSTTTTRSWSRCTRGESNADRQRSFKPLRARPCRPYRRFRPRAPH